MEPRRFSGNSHWYHETQSTLEIHTAPLVPEAASIEDRFLLGLASQCGDELNVLLQQAEPALQASRDLYQLLFPQRLITSRTHTLTLYDRLSTALTVAQVTGIQRLCNHYAARLNPLPGPDSSRESNRRLTQITEYARQLASQPGLIDNAALRRLDASGLTAPDIITFSQIIGFVSYQARVVAGVHALLALPVRWIPGITIPPDADPLGQKGCWQPELMPVELRYACPRQLDALTLCRAQPALRENARLLAHDPAVLQGWSTLLGSLDGPQQTPEGSLAAAAVARINGSPACFYRYRSGKMRNALRRGIEQAADVSSKKERAVIGLAAQLTRSPERFNAAHLQPLKEAGLSLQAIFGVIQITALAGWHNRLMQSLGSVKALHIEGAQSDRPG